MVSCAAGISSSATVSRTAASVAKLPELLRNKAGN